ncbi:MAG: hypothetical protein ACOXZR_03380 [Bacilli bacterium]|jgi:hypothetical protein
MELEQIKNLIEKELKLLSLLDIYPQNINNLKPPFFLFNQDNKKVGKIVFLPNKNNDWLLKSSYYLHNRKGTIYTKENEIKEISRGGYIYKDQKRYYFTSSEKDQDFYKVKLENKDIHYEIIKKQDELKLFQIEKRNLQLFSNFILLNMKNNYYFHEYINKIKINQDYLLKRKEKITLKQKVLLPNNYKTTITKEIYDFNNSLPLSVSSIRNSNIYKIFSYLNEEKQTINSIYEEINNIWPKLSDYFIINHLNEEEEKKLIKMKILKK